MTAARGSLTGRRLGWLLLAYLGVVVAVIVFAPFRFDTGSADRVLLVPSGAGAAADVLLNLVLFVPLGFLLERAGGGRIRPGLILVAGLLVSLVIETTQLYLPGRWTTLSDVVANGLGATLGALASVTIRGRLGSADSLAARLFLDLPLLGLCWLLLPMLWLEALQGPLLAQWSLAAAGGLAIAGAGRSNTARERQPAGLLWPLAAGWGLTATLPGLARGPLVMLSMAVTLVACAVGDRWWRAAAGDDRRVEPRAVAAILVALIPWFVIKGLQPRVGLPLRDQILAWLALGAGFTVLGYAISEWRGRSPLRWPVSALVPALVAAAVALPMTMGRPWLVAGAAAVAGFGSLLFDVSRDHVVARRLATGRDRVAD